MADASGNFIFDCLVGPCDDGVIYLSSISGIEITDALDTQILRYDEATGNWINDFDDRVFVRVFNNTGGPLSRGDAVYIESAKNSNIVNVDLADASDPDKMPAIGLLYTDVADGAEGLVVSFGKVNGVDGGWTSTDEGKKLYISPTTPGAVQLAKPTDPSHLIQNIGILMQAHPTNAVVKVAGAYRSNDVPNVSSVESSDDIDYIYVQNNNVFSRADIRTTVSALTSGDFENGGVLFWKGNPTAGQIDFGTATIPGSPGANHQLTWDNSNQQPKWTPQPAFPSSPATNQTLIFNGLSYESAPYFYPSYQSRANGTTQNLNASDVALNIQTLEASAGTDLDWSIANRTRLEILTDGDYKIACSIYGESTTQRANIILQMRLNGTTFFGPKGAGGYIRAASSHNEASVHISSFIYPLTSGDYIEVVSNIGGPAGSWTTTVGTSNLTVEKIR